MATLKRPFYYCTECKKILDDSSRLLFVDEHSSKGFCSEECIEDFHLPLVKHFEKEELVLREKYDLLKESISFKLTKALVDEVLYSPDEIYCLSNDIGDRFYHAIKKVSDRTHIVVITSLFKKEPSFVYGTIVTNSLILLDEYRQGEPVALINWQKKKSDQIHMPDDSRAEIPDEEDIAFVQLLESKKSKVLALLLIKRKEQDIPIEQFSDYDSCFQETLDHPDEVFEFKDNEGDVFFHYIKNYGPYFYVVLCLKRKNSPETETMIYPVLGMPTNDMALVNEFCVGKQLSGPLKN